MNILLQKTRYSNKQTKKWTKLLEGDLPVDDPAVNNLEDDDPLGTVFEEVRHLLLQLRLHLMLGDHLQVVP